MVGMNEQNQNSGKLIIFSAPSGAGKTTIVRHLLSCGFGLHFSVSATSRPPRMNESNGKDYYFLSAEEFREKINHGEFLEWEEVYAGTLYGTLKSEVDKVIAGGTHVIFDVDVKGGLNIKKQYREQALAVFVQPPSVAELKNRLTNRSTESEEKIRMRIEKAEFELSFASQFDVVLINDNLKETLSKAESIVRDFIAVQIQ